MTTHLPTNYYSCSNRDPDRDGPVTRSAFVYLDMMSIIMHVYIKLRISFFQRKNKIKDEEKPTIGLTNKSLHFGQTEFQSIADFTTNVVGVFAISSLALLSSRINSMTVTEMNRSPNYILMNLYQLIVPSIVTFIISTLYYSRHPLLRKTMMRELKNCFLSCPEGNNR